eukprot:Selendium_serpulae@DN11883_c0_g1_i1.p1
MSGVDCVNSDDDHLTVVNQVIEMKAVHSGVETADSKDFQKHKHAVPHRVQSIHRKGPSINIDSVVEGQTFVFSPQVIGYYFRQSRLHNRVLGDCLNEVEREH